MALADPLFKDNIKVHFAGMEKYSYSRIAKECGVHYVLFTVFGFICHKFNLKSIGDIPKCDHIDTVKYLQNNFKHVIMDSGLFTLMFGAQSGKKDKKFLEKWQNSLIEFVQNRNLSCTVVEVDCQKVLDPQSAWEFRKKLRDALPNNRQINVFHLEDGQKGLDRMIEFSDYMAISVPEIRIHRRKTYKEDVYQLSQYIKNKKPDIDIHLLGCTEKAILKKCHFCTSSDSTSYQSTGRYNTLDGFNMNYLKPEQRKRYIERSENFMNTFQKEVHKELSQNYKKTFCNICIAIEHSLDKYNYYAGRQD